MEMDRIIGRSWYYYFLARSGMGSAKKMAQKINGLQINWAFADHLIIF